MAKMVVTKIPGRAAIELPAFYHEFESYYPDCELQTKKWVVQNAQKDWVYMDCGANIGYYSILFSQLSPEGRVYAVEPTSTVKLLKENILHNRCNNVMIRQIALGLYPGHRVEKIFRIWGGRADEMEYEFTTVDELVTELGPKRLDCIKIDVDSFDFEVLMGSEKTLERFDPWVIVELNHALALRGHSNTEALAWLANHGYRQCLVLDYENFVLRRSGAVLASGTGTKIELDFGKV